MIPSMLHGFKSLRTDAVKNGEGRLTYRFLGEMSLSADERDCPKCGRKMHVHNSMPIKLQHLNFGEELTEVVFSHTPMRCPHCGTTKRQFILFEAEGHRIT